MPGPGDLNLKKSWNPALVKNQAKLWKQEQKQLEEYHKIKERQNELEAEKNDLELINLKYKNTNDISKTDKLKLNKLDWMYDDPAGDVLGGTGAVSQVQSGQKPNVERSEKEAEKTSIKIDTKKDVPKLKRSEIDELDPMSQIKKKYLEAGRSGRDRVDKPKHDRHKHRDERSDRHRHGSGRDHREHTHRSDREHREHRGHRSDRDGHRSHRHRDGHTAENEQKRSKIQY